MLSTDPESECETSLGAPTMEVMRTVYRMAEAIKEFGTNLTRRQLRRGLWSCPERGVVITHNGPPDAIECQHIALCRCPARSAFSGLTALAYDGLSSIDSQLIDVVLPEGARAPEQPGLRTHWSTKLDAQDVHPGSWPRRTRTERSVVDAASWSTSDRQARLIVIAAFQQQLVSARTIRMALTRRGSCKRRALIVESVLDAGGGIQSLPERDFDEIRRSAGLPVPSRQSKVKGKDGRYYLDVEWRQHGIAAEIHGIQHNKIAAWDADLMRSNEVVIGGRRLVAFTSFAIRHLPESVEDQLLRLFRSAVTDAA